MKRHMALLVSCAVFLVLGLSLIPRGHAKRNAKPAPAIAKAPSERLQTTTSGSDDQIKPEAAGLPNNLNAQSALSAALFTAIGGPNTQFDELPLIANWDGREDYVADRAQKVDDLSFVLLSATQFVTRTAVSEHTVANGFAENVFYYGDSAGNFFLGTDVNPGLNVGSTPAIDVVLQVNIPQLINTNTSGGITLLNPTGGDCSSASVTVTGIAVNPVADLSDFTGVACDTIGEVVYVSVLDATGCGTIKSRILAFAFTDGVGAAAATPQGALQLLRNPLSNAGIAVDDDGSLYFHLVDLANLSNGGAIFKVTETPRTVAACAVNPRVNRMVASIPQGLNGLINTNTGQGTAANPIITAAGQRLTNYSGPSTTFGNIVAIAAGPGNAIYAALSSSAGAINPQVDGLFTNPVALGATPSMIISFADRTGGGRDNCSSPDGILPGVIPIADGFADVAQAGLTRDPGVNNFRAFVLGAGPERRGVAAPAVFGTTANTLKIDMQIDFSIHAGLVADETGAIYVIAGGTPSGVGLDPSPFISEILAFPDSRPADRRADFIDLRGNALPNPPASGGNVGDGDSDRFDHIFLRAPVDQVSLTPSGLSGLARGFLRYTNRLAPKEISPTLTLGKTGGQTIQGDDDTTGAPIIFENLDPGHQVAGGDDQNIPFRGDDNDGAGSPPLVGPLSGGFEFTFGGPVGTAGCVWNGFFLNSNGNITFGAGDTANVATVTAFREGLPKIAGAWDDLNPNSRAADRRTFPVQALGFADINAFKVRYIDVPEFGHEVCTGTGGQASNTFSMTLFDDGTPIDENANQPLNPANPIGNNAVPFDLQEGPTDLRWTVEPNTNLLLGTNPRREGSGNFVFHYGRMDLLGTPVQPVITGYSIGVLSPTNPPGICETNLGNAAVSAAADVFGVVQSQTASIDSSLIGEGTEPTLFELFENGRDGSVGVGGQIIVANVDFDLRFEGNDPAEKSVQQTDGDRSEVGFFGIGCAPPANPQVLAVTPIPPVLVAPGQPAVGTAAAGSQLNSQGQQIATPSSGIINALGAVQLNILGTGFYQNEVTTICPGGVPAGDVPTERPGKSITTAAVLALDSNNDGVPDTNVALTNVTVLSRNLIRATAAPLATAPGTAFPLNLPGGLASLTSTTTFTAGDNNIFGPLTRTSTAVIDTGRRAPVIVGTSAVQGNCGLPQDLLISGFNFLSPFGAITGVKAVQEDNPANVIPATSFTVLNGSLIEARFNIGSANIGRTFRIFVTGPGGQSRNLLSTDPRPVAVPTGNEQGNAIIFTCSTPVSGSITFSANSYFVSEGTPAVTITAKREDSSGSLTVDYSTSDGTATQRADYTMAVGQITFAPGEATKTFQVLVNDDSYSEITESLNLTLTTAGNGVVPPGASSATLNITDNDNPPASTNVIDAASDFVTQQYHDFLNRDPDPAGLAFWTNEISSCGANAACVDLKRQNVSAAFFLSIEFQETGGDVVRTQRVAFGRRSDDATSRTPYEQFLRGARRVGQGVIVGQSGYQTVLETNKQGYATEVVTSSDFATRFPTSLDASSYVDALFMSAGTTPTSTETSAAIAAFGGGSTPGRVAALRSVADSNSVRQAEFNASFVLMQYYGYLRRNPTDPPDSNDDGYQFWRTKLNSFGGNFVQAEMVRAFLLSGEYRQRFGP